MVNVVFHVDFRGFEGVFLSFCWVMGDFLFLSFIVEIFFFF